MGDVSEGDFSECGADRVKTGAPAIQCAYHSGVQPIIQPLRKLSGVAALSLLSVGHDEQKALLATIQVFVDATNPFSLQALESGWSWSMRN